MSKKQAEQVGIKVPPQQRVALSDVNMAVYNPRIMPAAKMLALKASLLKNGFVLNLVVQKKGMVLIGGHQRVTAMREICAEKGWAEPSDLPASVLDVDDATAKLLNVALNNIEGEFDPYKLGEVFASVHAQMTRDDVLATGYLQENIDELLALVKEPDAQASALEAEAAELGALGEFGRSITLSLEFDTVEQRDAAKELLRTLSKDGKVKAGTIVLRNLKAGAALKTARHNGKHEADDRGAGAGARKGNGKAARGAER